MGDRFDIDPIERREFREVHGPDEREDWLHIERRMDERFDNRPPPARLLDEDDEMDEAA